VRLLLIYNLLRLWSLYDDKTVKLMRRSSVSYKRRRVLMFRACHSAALHYDRNKELQTANSDNSSIVTVATSATN